jgi:ATP/maltotriose-dependent transcriptional regulator MalT
LLSLEAEHANLRAALGWTQEQPECAVLGARLAGALGWFWMMHAHFSEGRQWLDRMRAALAEQGHRSGPVHAKLLLEAGWMALYHDDFEQARSLLRQSLFHYRELDDVYGTAFALLGLGRTAYYSGDQATAVGLEEESLALMRRHGTSFGIGYSLLSLGDIAITRGEVGRARELLKETIVHLRELGDAEMIGWTLINLGRAAMAAGELEQARCFFAETVEIFEAHSNEFGLAQVLYEQGRVAQAQGQRGRAGRLYQASLARFARHDSPRPIVHCLVALATLAAACVGEDDHGLTARATRLFGAADALCERLNLPIQLLGSEANDRVKGDILCMNGEPAWTDVWAEGRAMTLEQAIQYALEETHPE